MHERGISLAEVKEVYEAAEMTYPSPTGDTCLAKLINGRRIKIVVVAGTDRIKTAMVQNREE